MRPRASGLKSKLRAGVLPQMRPREQTSLGTAGSRAHKQGKRDRQRRLSQPTVADEVTWNMWVDVILARVSGPKCGPGSRLRLGQPGAEPGSRLPFPLDQKNNLGQAHLPAWPTVPRPSGYTYLYPSIPSALNRKIQRRFPP
jgi:hypothetical protein